jgi:peptide/nickel transport system ATP-binding protein/oligopeptide transport system ATP-binding protein
MIFQEPMTSLNPVFTIGYQIMEPIMLHQKKNHSQARDSAVEMLKKVGIPSPERRVDEYPHQLSGGMRQRAMIAMALSCRPSLLIADEPTTALDVTIQAQILELVKKLRHELGMGIVWITHDLGVVAGIADRVMVMYGGLVVEHAPVAELYGRPLHPYTRALLETLPSIDSTRSERLRSIGGQPPHLTQAPRACPFRDRCRHVLARCHAENPPLIEIGGGHQVACWWDAENGKMRDDV